MKSKIQIPFRYDFNLAMDETTWAEVWQCAKKISICNKTREIQFRILHHLQVSPQLRHRMNPNLTEMRSKCQVEVGSYRHCIWSCIFIEVYWGKITNLIWFLMSTLILNLRFCSWVYPALVFKAPIKEGCSMFLNSLLGKIYCLDAIIIIMHLLQLQDGTNCYSS